MQRRTLLKTLSVVAAAELTQRLSWAVGPAPEFFFNQLGYLPAARKALTVRGGALGSGAEFWLRSLTGAGAVFSGFLSEERWDEASGDRVCEAVFSSLTRPGDYVLEVSGAHSLPVRVAPDVYRQALRTTMRAFHGQRCGFAVDLGGGFRHPACHLQGTFHASSGRSGVLPQSGGWHDAGDYGRYVVNSGITCGTLLWAWEMFPSSLRGLSMDIPRGNLGLPDFLAEVKWNLDWMLSLQDGDGGVFHKQTSVHFCAFIMPEKDTLPSQVVGTGAKPYKSTCATADLAAVLAIAARCFGEFNKALAAQYLAAARSAWAWAMNYPDVTFRNPPGVDTGEYGDPHCEDELLWASAELWRTTGEQQFLDRFVQGIPEGEIVVNAPSWGNLYSMALWTYALAERDDDCSLRDRIASGTLDAAAQLRKSSAACGYGNSLSNADYGWGSNSTAANHSLLLAMANRLRPDPATLDCALENLHYLLGRNCHGVSWVTGVGSKSFLYPHHRPSAADGIEAPWPGLLSGGPNKRPADKVARTLPAMPPMRMWIDDQRAYSMNEVAINWNAPLVFLLAFANDAGIQTGIHSGMS